MSQRLRSSVVATACLATLPALASPDNITRGELARLPDYCPYTRTFDLAAGGFPERPLPAQQPWIAKVGPTFWSLHHFCWALVNANRATYAGVSRQQRAFLYDSAISDARFVLAHATPDFPLRPEVLLRIGQWYAALGKPAEALLELERVRDAKRDYWPAYLEISKINAKVGRRGPAIEALEMGLAVVPNQPQLTDALRKLRPDRSASDQRSKAKAP